METTASSKDTLVRVEGFSKMRATDLSARALAYSPGEAFTLAASSRSRSCSAGVRSSIERKSRATPSV